MENIGSAAIAIKANTLVFILCSINYEKLMTYSLIINMLASQMYYGGYSNIFSSLPANCFIRKLITNKELLANLHI